MSHKVKLRAVAKSRDGEVLAIGVDDELYRRRCGRWEYFPSNYPVETFEIIERIYPSSVSLTSRTIEVDR